MNNAAFVKTMENVRKYRCIKLVTTEARRNYLVPEPNYDTTKLIDHRREKTQTFMNDLVYLTLSISELSKIVMYEFLYDYVKPYYGEKAKLCYMDTDTS